MNIQKDGKREIVPELRGKDEIVCHVFVAQRCEFRNPIILPLLLED